MSMKFNMLSWVIVFAVAAYGLYMVKYQVEELRQANLALEDQLHHEKESLSMLTLEWAALNHPSRLRRLSNALLPMKPMNAERVVEISVLPLQQKGEHVAQADEGVR